MGIQLEDIDGKVLCKKSAVFDHTHDEGQTSFKKGKVYYYFNELKYKKRNKKHFQYQSENGEECVFVWESYEERKGLRFKVRNCNNGFRFLHLFSDYFYSEKEILNKKLKKIKNV